MEIYKCWNCGNVVTEDSVHTTRTFCQSCKDAYKEEYQDFMNAYLTAKFEIAWRRALRHMEKQENVNINDYYEEAEYVKQLGLSDFNKFQSSHEMMAAMELLKNRVKAKTQHKILRYKIDFFLPELKIVLEIDGQLHNFKMKKDSDRDVAILAELNANDTGWEVVRIPTRYLEQNIKQLIPAIKAVKKEKQRLRKLNGGFIPASFNRSAAYQNKKVAKLTGDKAVTELDNLLEDTIPIEL